MPRVLVIHVFSGKTLQMIPYKTPIGVRFYFEVCAMLCHTLKCDCLAFSSSAISHYLSADVTGIHITFRISIVGRLDLGQITARKQGQMSKETASRIPGWAVT